MFQLSSFLIKQSAVQLKSVIFQSLLKVKNGWLLPLCLEVFILTDHPPNPLHIPTHQGCPIVLLGAAFFGLGGPSKSYPITSLNAYQLCLHSQSTQPAIAILQTIFLLTDRILFSIQFLISYIRESLVFPSFSPARDFQHSLLIDLTRRHLNFKTNA